MSELKRRRLNLRRSLPSFSKILQLAKFELLLTLLTTFGVGVLFYLLGEGISTWITVTVAVIWVVSIIIIILYRVALQAERETTEALSEKIIEEQEESEALEKKIIDDRVDHSINLTTRVINFSTASLRSVTEELKQYSIDRKHEPLPISSEVQLMRSRMLQYVFRNVRSVFEGDTRGVDTTAWPHNYFKIALYEPNDLSEPKTLHRTAYDYPEGIEPSVETSVFDLEQHARAAVVLAFKNQDVLVIEDIKDENTKDAAVKRWIDRRDKQNRDYESMVCAAIVSGRRTQPERQCLAVLVIDTNRERYFLEHRDFQAFLGSLLNPFRTLLTLILELNFYLSAPSESQRARKAR